MKQDSEAIDHGLPEHCLPSLLRWCEREYRYDCDSDSDNVDDRPEVTVERDTDERVVDCRDDTENPCPSLILVTDRLDCEVGENGAADKAEQDVISVGVVRIQRP